MASLISQYKRGRPGNDVVIIWCHMLGTRYVRAHESDVNQRSTCCTKGAGGSSVCVGGASAVSVLVLVIEQVRACVVAQGICIQFSLAWWAATIIILMKLSGAHAHATLANMRMPRVANACSPLQVYWDDAVYGWLLLSLERVADDVT